MPFTMLLCRRKSSRPSKQSEKYGISPQLLQFLLQSGYFAIFRQLGVFLNNCVNLSCMEAAIGIEPMNKAFAELCLTTWLRRQKGGDEI